MENRNVFWNVYIFKTGVGTTGIVRADNLAKAAERVADMTKECVTCVMRVANLEDSNCGVIIFDNIFDNILREVK